MLLKSIIYTLHIVKNNINGRHQITDAVILLDKHFIYKFLKVRMITYHVTGKVLIII